MPYVTVSPVPIAGGTLIITQRRHMCRLTDNRFFCLYGQTGPNYTLGMVVNVDNIRSASPNVTILRTQTIPELVTAFSGNAFRVHRLNDTDVLYFQQTAATTITYGVLRINPVTNIITRVGTPATVTNLANFTIDHISYVSPNKAIAENTAVFGWPSAVSTLQIRKLTWNPETNTLTPTTLLSNGSFGNVGSTSFHKNVQISQSRDGNTWCIAWSMGPSANIASTSYTVSNRYIINPTNNTATLYTGGSGTAGFSAWLPIDATNHLLIKDLRAWRAYNGNTAAGADVTFCPTAIPNANSRNVYVTWLNQDYFLILASGDGGSYYPGVTNIGVYARIVKYTDTLTAETSPDTTTNLLIANDFTFAFYRDSYEYVSPDVALLYGVDSATGAYKIGILYSGS